MNYPFETYSSIELFYERIESNPNGHYPFGQSMFWHSGVHIFADSQKEFKPIINGKVVCYRISQDYKEVTLPPVLSEEELTGDWSDYKECYDHKTGKIKNEDSDKKYKISDCFILLEHTITIEKKEFTFYTLYMNLAPACENPNYDKSLKTDGVIHGHSINSGEEDFFIDKIGMPAKNKKDLYFDFAVLSSKSLKDFSSQNGKKLFWAPKKGIQLYQRGETSNNAPTEIKIPKWAYFEEIKHQEENLISYEIKITHIHVYLKKDSINDKNELIKPDGITFSDPNLKVYNPSKDLEFICNKVQSKLNNLKGKKVDVIKEKKIDAIYLKLKFDEEITFWTKEPLKTCKIGITDINLVKKYDKNPNLFNYTKIENFSEDIIQNIKDVLDTPILGNNGNKYYEVILRNSMNYKIYTVENDKNLCYESALDFDKWFYFYKEADSIICDRTKVVTDTINKHDDMVKKAMLLVPIIGIWWTGILTWTFLKYAYGKLSSEKKSEGGVLTKPEIRKIVCCHPIEWDKNQFSNLEIKNSDIKKKLVNESTAIDLWNGGLNKIFTKNPYFYHPLYFINHVEKAALLEFNPYKGFNIVVKSDYCAKTKKKDGTFHATGSNGITHKNVQDNPGFAPITTLKTDYIANGLYFSNITGGFKEDYTDVIVDAVNELTYREKKIIPKIHQGIDFSGRKASKILSLINGTVIGYGSFGNFGNAVIVGRGNGKGVYLEAHLDSFNEEVLSNGFVKPSDSIGIIGKTGAGGVVHLHVSYYDYNWIGKNIVTKNNGILSKGVDYAEMGKYLANPFEHSSKF